MSIHPTAIIDPGAELDQSVSVGPYVVIEDKVRIGANTEIKPHTVITGPTTIGSGNTIGPFATVGAPPQDLKYKGEDSTLVIGDNNQIREYVSIHRGTEADRGETTIGSANLLMGYVHIAHDCVIGDNVILANGATLAGHVRIDNRAILGGLVGVNQFIRIGAHCYIGGLSGLNLDVPPYVIVSGIRKDIRISGINKVGLKRCGYDNDTLRSLDKAFKIIFRSPELLLKEALAKVEAECPGSIPVAEIIEFFKSSKMGVVRNTNGNDG